MELNPILEDNKGQNAVVIAQRQELIDIVKILKDHKPKKVVKTLDICKQKRLP